MYFVDREKIETILGFIEKQLSLLENTDRWDTIVEKAALERVCHSIIEGILDVGNAMIDGFIMRDPGSYEDIIDILDDEKVISEEMSVGLKEIIHFRKMLVQDYTSVNHQELQTSFSKHLAVLKNYAPNVREYLINELGPVSAFKS